MSQHVQRASRDYSFYYVLLWGLIIVAAVYYYDRPRTAYVEVVPKAASIYLDNILKCEGSPCEVELPFWPQTLSIRAEEYAPQNISVLKPAHFTKGHQTFHVKLTPHARPKAARPFEPKTKKEEGRSQTRVPILNETDKEPPRPLKSKTRTKPQPTQADSLDDNKFPTRCHETQAERQRDKNRSPILCYDEDAASMNYGQLGVCYATYDVSSSGRVSNIIVHDCTHKALIDQAKRTLAKRHYLPALTDARPVNSYVSIELEYGKADAYYYRNSGVIYGEKRPPLAYQTSKNTVNRDASVISCPPPRKPKRLTRSGYCIFDFDLSASGRISTVRQTRCTQEGLKSATLASLNQCKFNHAISDEKAVSRAYMTQQIDIDIFDSQGRKIPPHAAFRQTNTNKPYIVYE